MNKINNSILVFPRGVILLVRKSWLESAVIWLKPLMSEDEKEESVKWVHRLTLLVLTIFLLREGQVIPESENGLVKT